MYPTCVIEVYAKNLLIRTCSYAPKVPKTIEHEAANKK